MSAIIEQKQTFSLTPKSLDEALRFAEMLSKSNIIPRDYQGNPGNVIVAVQWGMEVGLQPLQAMQNIAVINGRPSIWGDSMLAIVRGSGLLESIKEVPTDDGCTCTIKRKGEQEVTRTFSREDAKCAGLLGKQGPWQAYPKRMMQMRARAYALRDVFPDVLRGVEIAEEARDKPPVTEKDMGAAEVVEAPKPISKTAALKSKLGRKKAEKAEPAVSIDEVMAAISAACDEETMAHAAQMAAGLQSEDDKALARQAYSTRRDELKRVADRTDDVPEPAAMTFAEVADRLVTAKTPDELDLAADSIRMVADKEQQAELMEIFKKAKKRF